MGGGIVTRINQADAHTHTNKSSWYMAVLCDDAEEQYRRGREPLLEKGRVQVGESCTMWSLPQGL